MLQVGPKTRIYFPLIGKNGPAAASAIPQALSNGAPATYHFGRNFPIGQDWSAASEISFWYYGRNSNNASTSTSPTTGQPPPILRAGSLFGAMSSTAPQAKRRTPTSGATRSATAPPTASPVGATTSWSITAPAAPTRPADGQGKLVITTRAADGSLQCYYGPCKYTSARLLTKNRFEVA